MDATPTTPFADLATALKTIATFGTQAAVVWNFTLRLIAEIGCEPLFKFLGPLLVLGTSFAEFYAYVQYLHLLPPWWGVLLASIVLGITLYFLAHRLAAQGNPSTGGLVLAALLYSIVTVLLTSALIQVTAESFVYYPLTGRAVLAGGGPAPGQPVYLRLDPGGWLRSRTSRRGEFQFLLTKDQAAAVAEVCVSTNEHLKDGANWLTLTPWAVDQIRWQRVTPDLEVPSK